jgi:acyl carrier protein
MKRDVLLQLQVIFRDAFDDENIELAEETTSNDIEGWDSLMHFQLIVLLENHFKIKFSSKRNVVLEYCW